MEDVDQICNQEKTVPLEWITENGSDIGEGFIGYARPLIQGEVKVPMEDGLPKSHIVNKRIRTTVRRREFPAPFYVQKNVG